MVLVSRLIPPSTTQVRKVLDFLAKISDAVRVGIFNAAWPCLCSCVGDLAFCIGRIYPPLLRNITEKVRQGRILLKSNDVKVSGI